MRQTIGPKIMRPKIVEENLNNFNAVSKDAVARFIKLKETSQEEGHIPDLEKEMKRWALEGKLKSLSALYPLSQVRTRVNSLSAQVKAKKTWKTKFFWQFDPYKIPATRVEHRVYLVILQETKLLSTCSPMLSLMLKRLAVWENQPHRPFRSWEQIYNSL